MATVVTIDQITAPDAVAGTAPHKISNKATKDSLSLKFTPTSSGTIRKWVVREAPSNHNTGTVLGKRGMVCGTGDTCGNAGSVALAHPSGTQVTEGITYSEANNVDGDYTVQAYAMSTEEGWSA